MNVREKLVELLNTNACPSPYMCDPACRYYGLGDCFSERFADHLIAHGVTVQEWVDVKDRLPEESGMYIVTANDGHAQRVSFVQWQKKNRMWNLTGARSYWRVSHWQPLPQPPKGE